jgi:hypothetical protein
MPLDILLLLFSYEAEVGDAMVQCASILSFEVNVDDSIVNCTFRFSFEISESTLQEQINST